jgi:hypothetical protein
VVSRSTAISITGNVFTNCRDAALGIDQDSTHTISDVTATGNVIYNTRGLSVGIGRTTTTGGAFRINFSCNLIVTSSNWTDIDVSITDVKNLRFCGNVIDADRSYSAGHVVISVSEYTASYFEDVTISDNSGKISGSGNNYLVQISTALAASSGGLIEMNRNRLSGATRLYLYGSSGSCTNANIRSDWDFEQDITASGTPSIAGYNRFNVELGSAGNITGFADAYDGKQIELFFANGNATLTNAMNLAAAANFVGSSSDYMVLKYRGPSSNWFEICRSVN